MDDKLVKQSEELTFLFRSIIKNFRQYVQNQVCGFGYTVPQFQLLKELYLHPDITLKELSERLSLAKSTVSGIVDRLEAQGAVIRTRVEEDRRTVRIALAPETLKLKESLQAIKNNYMAGMLSELEPEEVEQILESFRKIHGLVEEVKTEE